MSERKANGDAKRARALDRRGFRAATHRQRRDGHQVIGAETVQKSEDESGREKNQDVTAVFSRREASPPRA